MKRTLITLTTIIAFLILSSTSCGEDEPFTQIKMVESQIFNAVEAHRIANGVSGNFVHQFIMVKEAQLYSATMAFGTQDVSTSGLQPHWDIIHDKIGGINDLSVVQSTISSSSAADIVKAWTDVPEIDSMILLNYSQCGVGVEYGANSMAYITLMMMLVE